MKNTRKILFAILAVIVLSLFAPSIFPAGNNAAVVEAKKARLTRTGVTLRKGQKITLKILHRKRKKVRWHTTNPKVATVSRGTILAKAPGKCTVYVQHGKRRLNCSVTVRKDIFKVSNSSLRLKKGETETILVYSEIKSAITVSTNNKYIATAAPLTGPGSKIPVKITGEGTAGNAIITIKEKRTGRKLVINVTVNGSNSFRIENSADTNITLKEGETRLVWIRSDLRRAIGMSVTDNIIEDENANTKKAISWQWGASWNDRLLPLNITGENASSKSVQITLMEAGTNKKIAMSVTVIPGDSSGDPDNSNSSNE